jgi:hypothetical protein
MFASNWDCRSPVLAGAAAVDEEVSTMTFVDVIRPCLEVAAVVCL